MTAPRSTAHDRRWWILGVLCLSLLTVVVDGTIINTALPTLATELKASTSDLQWIVDAYELVFAGLLLTAGALGDRFGRHRFLAGGLVVFGAASLLAALAADSTQLIGARALMGVGGAMIMPATLSILSDVFTDKGERAKAIGIWTATSGLGVAIGPSVGGLLLEHFAWGSVFLINLPIVAFALFAGHRLIPASHAAERRPLDPVGAGLSLVGLTTITYGLITAPEHGWTSVTTAAILGGGLAVMAAFAAWERRVAHPMVELALFRNLRFSAASGSVTIIFFSLFGSLFLLTQILQFVLGYSTLKAGLGALPYALTVGAVAPVAAALAPRIGTKIPVTAGLAVLALGLLIMSGADTSTTYGYILLATVVMAAGMGLAMAPATDAIMGALPAAKAGVGSAINDVTRQLGGVLGIAIIGSIASSAYTRSMEAAGASDAARESLGGAIAAAGQDAALLETARAAFMDAASQGVLVAAAVAAVGAVIAWTWLPARHAEVAGAAAPAMAS